MWKYYKLALHLKNTQKYNLELYGYSMKYSISKYHIIKVRILINLNSCPGRSICFTRVYICLWCLHAFFVCLFVWLGFLLYYCSKVEDREEYNKIQQIQYYSKDTIRGLKDLFLCSKLTKSCFENIFMSVYLCLGFFVVVVLFFEPCEGLLP